MEKTDKSLDEKKDNLAFTSNFFGESDDSIHSRLQAKLEGKSENVEGESEDEDSEKDQQRQNVENDDHSELESEDDFQNSDDHNDDHSGSDDSDDDDSDNDDDHDDDSDGEENTDDDLELNEDQIAVALGLPTGGVRVDDNGNTLVRTKVDGKVSYVPLTDAIASYQMESHLQGRIRTQAEAEKQFADHREVENTRLQTAVTEALSVLQEAEQHMFAGYQGLDLNALKNSDPGRWAAVMKEIEQKQQLLQESKGKIGKVIQEQREKFQQEQEDARVKRVNEEADALIGKIPTWSNPEVAAKEMKDLVPVAEQLGYTAEEFGQLDDHRVILAIRGYARSLAIKDSEDVVRKRLKKIPKTIKPGNSRANGDQKTRKARQRKQNLDRVRAAGGSTDAVAAALLDRV